MRLMQIIGGRLVEIGEKTGKRRWRRGREEQELLDSAIEGYMYEQMQYPEVAVEHIGIEIKPTFLN